MRKRFGWGAIGPGILISFFLGGIGLIFVALSIGDFWDYLDSSDWLSASGEVISSEVQTSSDSDGDTTYRAHITYFYVANDHRYNNDRLDFGGSIYTSSSGSAREKVNDYPPETLLTVLYNAANPQDSVIERRLSSGLVIFLGAGMTATLAGLLIFLWMVVKPIIRGR